MAVTKASPLVDLTAGCWAAEKAYWSVAKTVVLLVASMEQKMVDRLAVHLVAALAEKWEVPTAGRKEPHSVEN